MKLRKTLTMLTLANSRFRLFAADSLPEKAAYAVKHGYGLVSYAISDDQKRPASWYRLQILQECGHISRWMFCTDADSVVWNMEMPLTPYMDERFELIVTWDGSGLNTGNYFVRMTDWMREFVRAIWWNAEPEEIGHHTWEQNRLRTLYAQMPDLRARTKVMPQRFFNAFAAESDTVIMHYSGVHDLKERLELQMTRSTRLPVHPDGNSPLPERFVVPDEGPGS